MKCTKEHVVEENTPGCYLKTRYVLAFMTALGTLNIYSLRNGINVAIVAMASGQPNLSTSTFHVECLSCSNHTTESSIALNQTKKLNWSLNQQTLLLGCYYYGYCITNLPGAWLTKRLGIRLVVGLTSLLSAILTMLMPVAIVTNFYLAVGLRVVVGFLQGVTFPAAMTGWGLWAPPLERSRLVSATLSGVATGIFIVYPFVGIIIYRFGWEASFYVTGAIGVIYSIVFLSIIHDSPAVHPSISRQERDYIEMSIYGQKNPQHKNTIPWRKILTSLPVLSTVSSHLGANWATITVATMAPTFIANVYGFDIKSVGFLSALPFLLSFIFLILGSLLTDWIIGKRWLRVIVLRKVMSCMPLFVVACSMIMLSYVGRPPWVAVFLLCASIGSLGLTASGHVSSFLDIAPNYGGILYSISNTMAGAIGFIAPQLAGAMVTDETLATSWQGVFWLSAGICTVSGLIFLFFASDQVQPWAKSSCFVQPKVAIMSNEEMDTQKPVA